MAKTIMIVDDSALQRRVISMALKKVGYDIIEACDGKEALAKLNSGVKLNLIISDVYMPKMDGITFLKQVRAHPVHKLMPVIMVTTKSEDEVMPEGQALAAQAWVIKPFQLQQILSVVAKYIL